MTTMAAATAPTHANTAAASATRWQWETALSGVVPPLISPLDAQGEPDPPAIRRLVAHALEGGCSGLFVLGGCGEGPWLTVQQRSVVIRTAVEAAAGRAPVLAGCMLPATAPAVEAAQAAAQAGADALVVGSPYYFTASGADQRRHVTAILDAVDRPALLYNIPPSTHHTLSPDTVAALAADPRILGIKDSAGDLKAFDAFVRVKQSRASFRVLQGHEGVMGASLLMGGDGLVPGLANVAPRLFVALQDAVRARDLEQVWALQEQIDHLGELHAVGGGAWLPPLKAACAHLGICTSHPAAPWAPLSDADARTVAAIVDRYSRI